MSRTPNNAKVAASLRDAVPLVAGPPFLMDGRVPPARGFTLIELLVVLAILVAIMAMAWPAMRRSLDRYELRASAHQVAAQLHEAKHRAQQSGQPQQFRYRAGGDQFAIAPAGRAIAPDDPWWLAGHGQSQRTFVRHSYAEDDSTSPIHHGRVADGVVFASSAYPDEAELDRPPSPYPSTSEWSAPLVFDASGRTGDTVIRLTGRRGFSVDIRVRGALGQFEVGHPQRWASPVGAAPGPQAAPAATSAAGREALE